MSDAARTPGWDLTEPAVAAALPGRPTRAYPALLSTQAEALAWARAGAPSGAVVVADYQASPRGRGGIPWQVRQGQGLGFSIVLRPPLPPAREGWPYTIATCALADVVGETADIHWPDEVHAGGSRVAAVGVDVEPGPQRILWAVVTLLVEAATPPRAQLLADHVRAIEARLEDEPAQVLGDHRSRCATLGRKLRARLIPVGPAGPQVEGVAVDLLEDGALVLRTDRDRRVAIPPQNLGVLEEAL